MSQPPSPDYRKIPNAHRAYLLQPADPEQDPAGPGRAPRAGRTRRWLRKPANYLVGLVVAACGIFGTNYLVGAMTTSTERLQEPITVYDVKLDYPPAGSDVGAIVPGAHFDPDAVEWGYGMIPEESWMYDRGGASAGWAQWEFTLESKRSTDITIDAIYPDNISCTDPLNGTYFHHIEDGMGDKIAFGVEIDEPRPEFHIAPDEGAWPDEFAEQPVFSDRHTITLEPGTQTVVQFAAHATTQYCEWTVALDYTLDGQRSTLQVAPSDTGHFALTAILPVGEFEAVLIPPHFCPDFTVHSMTGTEAEAYFEAMRGDGPVPDCP